MNKFFFLFISIVLSNIGFSSSTCDQNIETIPVQADGRIKPFSVLSVEVFKFITPEKKPFGFSKAKALCLLSNEFYDPKDLDLPIKIEHVKARKLLEIDQNKTSMNFSDLEGYSMEIRAAMMKIKENNSYKKELQKISSRINYVNAIKKGKLFSLYDKSSTWRGLDSLSLNEFNSLFQVSDHQKKLGNTYMFEHYLFKYHPFGIAIIFILLSIFSLSIFKKNALGMSFAVIALIIQVLAIAVRVYVSGRAPITNMYETVMFSGFGAALIAYVLTLFKKEKIFLIAGLGYNVLCLFMMIFANNMLNPAIKNLEPVLRDNFWLSTHVTCVILSYAALAISWILANIYIVKTSLGKGVDKPKHQVKVIYTCVQIGVVLLAAGVILGGVWADYSWGRFWGWDPKETWSLIALLIYMAILHGKYTSWINDKNFIPLIAAAFLSVIMAWFGVNYILASGLHSYGFSEGGAIFIGSVFLAQMSILALHFFPKNRKV